MSRSGPPPPEHLRRWRLVLGRYAEGPLGGAGLSGQDRRMDRALDYLYGRELAERGLRASRGPRAGSLDLTQLTPLHWLGEVRALFPQSVYETIQGHAIDRYEMHELLNDPRALESLEPNRDLLKSLVAFKGRANPAVREKIRALARRVVEEVIQRLRPRVQRALSGAPNRFRRSQLRAMQNFDWRATIRENLRHYDTERRALIAQRLRFYGRVRRRLPWTVILCLDQSGSMLDSVIYTAVMAAILAGLPSMRLHLVVFDTSVVDLSDQIEDPVEVLMSVQLGGGTDIGQAVRYCEQLVTQPRRTVFVLVSDLCEGAPVPSLVAAVRRLAEARVTLLGLAALDDRAEPDYDRGVAERLSAAGMHIAALTPDRFADWLGEVIE